MEKVGTEENPTWQKKYSMGQLLDPDFRLPIKSDELDGISDDVFGIADGIKYDEVK